MGTTQLMVPCSVCGQVTPHTQQTANHILHLLLTLFTFFIWAFVWLLAGITASQKPRCNVCGYPNKPGAGPFRFPPPR